MSEKEGWWIPVLSIAVAIPVALVYAYWNYAIGKFHALDATKVIVYAMTILGTIVGLLALGLMGMQRQDAKEAKVAGSSVASPAKARPEASMALKGRAVAVRSKEGERSASPG
jgi:hypothetical protein